MAGNLAPAPLPSPSANQTSAHSGYGQQFAQTRPSPSPVPLMQQNSYGSHGSSTHSALPQTPLYPAQNTYPQYAPSPTPVAQHANPMGNYNLYQGGAVAPRPVMQDSTSHTSHSGHTNTYNPPRPTEVWTLADTANASIPVDIRAQFHHDEYGKIIFFTSPPLDANPGPEEVQILGHSLQYLADKARNKEADEKKRKAREIELETAATEKSKRIKADEEGSKQWILDQKLKALMSWSSDTEKGTDELYKKLHGEKWQQMRELDLAKLAVQQEQSFNKQKELEKFQKESKAKDEVRITGFKWI
jgi:chromatin structure-remodeling complex subunit RSC1/2